MVLKEGAAVLAIPVWCEVIRREVHDQRKSFQTLLSRFVALGDEKVVVQKMAGHFVAIDEGGVIVNAFRNLARGYNKGSRN